MRRFDSTQPLIFIHVPKSAGTSVREVVEGWFPGRVHRNYFNRAKWCPPDPLSPETLWNRQAPPVIFGHFNRNRDFGVEHLYPTVRQFITILRDPFETMVSTYFYAQRREGVWRHRALTDRLEDFLEAEQPNILNHFPRVMTLENHRDIIEEFFIEIGVTEHLSQSLSRIAGALGVGFDPAALPTLNVSKRDQPVPEGARAHYEEKFPLERAVYDYALRRLEGAA